MSDFDDDKIRSKYIKIERSMRVACAMCHENNLHHFGGDQIMMKIVPKVELMNRSFHLNLNLEILGLTTCNNA